jgi:hypothetical protein
MLFRLLLPLVAGCGKDGPTEIDTDDGAPTGCGGDDAACDDGDICDVDVCVTGDRDNTFDEATPILQEQPVDAAIEPEGDIDYYRYTSLGDEWLRIDTGPDEMVGGRDTVLVVYNAVNGAVQAWIDDYATGSVSTYDSVLYVYLPTAGDWIIAVEDRGTYFDDPEIPEETGDYTLQLRAFTSITDETDAIDDPSVDIDFDDANTIYAVGVNLADAGDTDFIDVAIPWDRGPIEIAGMAEIPGSDLDATVGIWDGDVKLASKESLGPDGWAYYFDTHEGTYHVSITDDGGGGGPDFWTVLFFRTREDDYYGIEFESEPDDDVANAQDLPTTTQQTSDGTDYEQVNLHAFVDVAADEDWFSVDADADDYVTVYCSEDVFGSFADTSLEVVDIDGTTVLDSADEGNDRAPDVVNAGPLDAGGTVYLHFTDAGGASGPSAYTYCNVYVTPFEVVTD